MQYAVEYLNKQSRPFLMILAFVLVDFVIVIDAVIDPEIPVWILYLVPVCLVAWFVDKQAGIVISFASTIGLFADYSIDSRLYQSYSVSHWNALMGLGLFLIATYALGNLKNIKYEESSQKRDLLTGLINAESFLDLVNAEEKKILKYGHQFTVVRLDIDNFQDFTSRFGLAAGDAVLRLVGDTTKDNVRAFDVVGRLGHEEFGILLPNCGQDMARVIARRVRDGLFRLTQRGGWPVTFRISSLTFSFQPGSTQAIIKKSDFVVGERCA